MSAADIIKQIQDDMSEWTEMSDNPAALVAGVLANKLVNALNHIQYLEKRLKYDSSSTSRIN